MAPEAPLLPDDYRRLFEAAPGCYLVLSPDLTIAAVSDAYLRATMTVRNAILGRKLFEVFPDNPDDPGATGVANLRASLERVLANRRPDTMPVQKYDIRRPEAEGGGFLERHWSPVNSPVLGEDGSVRFIIHQVEDVTEVVLLRRREREQGRTLQELAMRSEERFAQLLDAAPDAMVVASEDGRIRLINAQTERMFGYGRAELVGQPISLLIPERFRAAHAGHEARFFASPAARAMGANLQLWGRHKDGSELPIEVSLSPLKTEQGTTVSAAIRDISERKRLEGEHRRAAERLASAVETIQDAFALFDDQDKLVLCNSAYRSLLGEALPGPVVGRSYPELLQAWARELDFPDEAARELFRQERLSRRSQELSATFDVHTRDGRSLRVMDRRTAEGGIVKTIWDLTEDERRAQELREARIAAEAASAAKSDFLSSMSHELRTPLNAILGFAQLLQRDRKEPLSERHKERVEQILKGGEHLLRLIDDVLDLSRIEAGRVSLSPEPVGVADVLEEVRRTLEPMTARLEVRLAIEPLPPGLPMVVADRTRLAQILMNFGSNAIKYNRRQGSVTYWVSQPQPDRVRVAVRDTGLGIAAEKQDKLFQPFQRAGQEMGPIEGTGIGLVITKRFAELMGGQVGFRSEPGQGSEFWLELPAHTIAARPDEPSAAPSQSPAPTTPAGRSLVLYVEDNPANISFMRDLIGGLDDLELLTAPTAELGVELAQSRRPKAIIMDINLPGKSGIDALHVLRAMPETRTIPVIALSAAASERDKQRGIQAGFQRYLTKPVKVDELISALEGLLASPS